MTSFWEGQASAAEEGIFMVCYSNWVGECVCVFLKFLSLFASLLSLKKKTNPRTLLLYYCLSFPTFFFHPQLFAVVFMCFCCCLLLFLYPVPHPWEQSCSKAETLGWPCELLAAASVRHLCCHWVVPFGLVYLFPFGTCLESMSLWCPGAAPQHEMDGASLTVVLIYTNEGCNRVI